MPPFASSVSLRRGKAIEVGRGSDAAADSSAIGHRLASDGGRSLGRSAGHHRPRHGAHDV